jgi:hypothetical protein
MIPDVGSQININGAALRAPFFSPVRFDEQVRHAPVQKKPLMLICGEGGTHPASVIFY